MVMAKNAEEGGEIVAKLEKVGFEELAHETVNLELRRQTRSMEPYQFLLGMVLALYVGFSRLNHLQSVAREPMLLRILRVARRRCI